MDSQSLYHDGYIVKSELLEVFLLRSWCWFYRGLLGTRLIFYLTLVDPSKILCG